MEIDLDLYNKLLKCGIFRASPNTKILNDKKKAVIDKDTGLVFENGVALGRYMLLLKEMMVRNRTLLISTLAKIQSGVQLQR